MGSGMDAALVGAGRPSVWLSALLRGFAFLLGGGSAFWAVTKIS